MHAEDGGRPRPWSGGRRDAELFLETLRQLESTPFEELLLQVAREHLRVREQSSAPTTSIIELPKPTQGVPRDWSGAHTKKVLADFFAVDVRLLARELNDRGIVFKKGSRQSYRVDLNMATQYAAADNLPVR